MACYRLGAVPYLNGKPLVHHFEQKVGSDVFLTEDVPSRLVKLLRAGELDAALASSIVCLEDPEIVILPGVCIAADGPVDSIRLFCKVEPHRMHRIALDTSSRTSVALVRILLAERYGISPECVAMPPDLDTMLDAADAGLLIGDPAMRAFYLRPERHKGLHVLDLGAEWHALTGLPFVYAVWAARRDADSGRLAALVREAWEAGRPHLDAIADAAAGRLGLPPAVCRNYLRHVMVYDLGVRELQGLVRFRDLALKHGLLPGDAPPVVVGR